MGNKSKASTMWNVNSKSGFTSTTKLVNANSTVGSVDWYSCARVTGTIVMCLYCLVRVVWCLIGHGRLHNNVRCWKYYRAKPFPKIDGCTQLQQVPTVLLVNVIPIAIFNAEPGTTYISICVDSLGSR